jgi:diaminopimelate decarboxylase
MDLNELAKTFGTPLLVIDERQLRSDMRRLKDAFRHPVWCCDIAYAAKALALKAIAKIAHEEGLGFDACSEGELETALQAGVPPQRCILHGCAKTERELELAVRSSIRYVVVDNAEEIETLQRIARRTDARVPILVRVNVAVHAATRTQIQTSAPESKFGFPISDGQARDAVLTASRSPSLAFCGLHCHIGSQISELAVYGQAITRLADFMLLLERDHGIGCDTMNLGGGLGLADSDGGSQSAGPTPQAWAETIFEALERCFKDGRHKPKILVEPGRAVVARAGSTLYAIAARKILADGSRALIVDGGMSDNPRPALYEAVYGVTLASRPNADPDGRYTIFGRHCETDLLFRDVPLADPKVGDILEVHNTGAYTYSMASNYNRFPKPAVVLSNGDSARVIAKRESVARLLDLDVLDVSETV